MKIEAEPPYDVLIDGHRYTDKRTHTYKESHRLTAGALALICRNILALTGEYDVYMDNLGDNTVYLYVDDDEMIDSYSIELLFIE